MPSLGIEANINRKQFLSPDGVGGGVGSPEPREALRLKGKRVAITGTSRGIGADIAFAMAEEGADIVGVYRQEMMGKRQDRTAERVTALGSSFRSIRTDVSLPEGQDAFVSGAIGDPQNPDPVHIVILNAAGGLEKDKGEEYADQINVDANVALVNKFAPFMPPGGIFVYMTSYWANQYDDPTIKQLPSYEPIARSKYKAEQTLREKISIMANQDIRLGVVVGHVISGTGTQLLFTRYFPEEMARLEALAEGGKFPDTMDMARAVRDLVMSDFESGHTVYVGGTNVERIEQTEVKLDREGIKREFPMYGDDRLYIDTFRLSPDRKSGHGTYTIRPSDVEGHFTGPFGDIQLSRGVDRVEALAQLAGLTYKSAKDMKEGLGYFIGTGETEFPGPIFPGETVDMDVTLIGETKRGVLANGEMKVGDEVVATVKDINIGLAPNADLIRSSLRRVKASRERKRQNQ